MNIEGFRAAAYRPNAVLVVDPKSAEVKVRNNHVLNRVVTWLRRRFSPNPMRDAARDAAHNRFLQAIADRRSGYDGGDVNRARELLADDVLERKPLSSRRIREVLDDLDGRSDATTRVNRRVAAYFRDQTGITNTLAARDLAADSRDEQSDNAESSHSGDVGAGSPSPADDPHDPAPTSGPGTAREDIMVQARIRPFPSESTESAAVPETADDTAVRPPVPPSESTESATVSETAKVSAAGARRTARAQAAKAEAGTMARQRAKPKSLTRELARAGLPGEVATHLKKLIGARDIVDADGLAKHGNERTARWVVENRVGRWYVEALKDKGVKRLAAREGTVSVPSSLLSDIARSIADSPVLRKYPDIKVQARDLIALHVKQEVDQGTSLQGGVAPSEPADRARRS